ncbi:MAG: phosphodiesterase [Ruminococcaceae bacterium]|nr:phosphodiesterase [Oscillospiraceae bacterium]
MKYFVASDIHGSDFYLTQLIEAFEKEQADKMILLGDILYHGPRNDLPKWYAPKEVIPKLNALKDRILCVKGNCDTEVDQMVLEFPIMADYAIITSGKEVIYITHGHNHNSKNLPPINKNEILLHGHTHVPVCNVTETHIYMNPGSVSIPKENSPHSYMIIEDGVFTWKNLQGEIYKEFRR